MDLRLKGYQCYQIETYYISWVRNLEHNFYKKGTYWKLLFKKIRFKANMLNISKCLYLCKDG